MHDWLTIELALGTLLVTSYACVGLVALWAATSPRHWFVRTAVVLGVLSPLLFVPAYEPFVAFVLESLVIVAGVQVARWWRRQRAENPTYSVFRTLRTARLPAVRFSLLTFLLATVLVAGAITIGVRIPVKTWPGMTEFLLPGATFGFSTLLAAWLVYGHCGVGRRVAVVAVFCLLGGILLACLDDGPSYLIDAMDVASGNWQTAGTSWDSITWIWFPIVAGVVLTVTLLIVLWRLGRADIGGPGSATHIKSVRWVSLVLFFALAILASVPPAAICWGLLHPLPPAVAELPDPNGYDDLVAAGAMFTSPILNTAVEPKSTAELAAEVAKYSAAYDRCRLGLSRPVAVPMEPPWEDYISRDLVGIGHLRTVARALFMEAELARREERYSDAARIAIDNVRLAHAASRGGILTNWLSGIAFEGMGYADLYRVIGQLTPADCLAYSHTLLELEADRESLDTILRRDRAFIEKAYRWPGHLLELLGDIVGKPWQDSVQTWIYSRYVATSRLLSTELALRAYAEEHSTPATRLNELLPEYLPEVPVDPFDPAGGPLRYRPDGIDYLLYSVGADGDDDGGRPMSRNEYGGLDMDSEGDLRLDVYFAPDEDPDATADGDEADESAADGSDASD